MSDIVIKDASKIIATTANLFKNEGSLNEFRVLSEGECDMAQTGYDNWDGGTDIYGVFCKVPLALYSELEQSLEEIQQNIKKKAEVIMKAYGRAWLGEVVISPILSDVIEGKSYQILTDDLLVLLEQQKALMISVSTGGQDIKSINGSYIFDKQKIDEGLAERGIKNTNTFKDLWAWYGRWSDGTLPKYHQRRTFISDLLDPVIAEVKKTKTNTVNPVNNEPTGWHRVDRGVGELRLKFAQAKNEEQYQVVGLLGREILISLAQAVYDHTKHPTLDKVEPSKTDAKRMLEAYIAAELVGSSNEIIRKHAKASLDLANELTHKRTADFRLAALSAEATCAVVNIIAIISGRRDPKI